MDGIDLMATAMHAAQSRLDVSAANLANVSSAGFHKRVVHAALTDGGLVTSSAIDASQGPLRRTGRTFDVAFAGPGEFFVRDAAGHTHESRSASFQRTGRGQLVDERGRILLGTRGPLVVGPGAAIDARGDVREAGVSVGTVRLTGDGTLQSGFLEGANVDAVREMVDVLGAERAFETAQKTLSAIDETRQKNVNDVARVKQ